MSNAQENQLKLSGIVDVRAFGAKGDGTTDDAAAFTAALAASRHVLVPAGTYRLASTVTLPENTVLQGAGRRASIIKVDAAVVGMSKTYASKVSTNVMKIEVRGLGFQGTATALGALHFDKGDHVVIDSCDFYDFTATGAYGAKLTNVYHWQVSNSKFENIKAVGLWLASAGGVGCNAGVFGPNNDVIGNNQTSFIGLLFDRGQNVLVYGTNFEGSSNGNKAIDLNGVEGVLITQNYIELWVNGAITANSGLGNRRVTVEQNVINANSTNVCNFNDTAVTNQRITFRANRFADVAGGQTCVFFGATTNAIFEDNDPASGIPTDALTASPRSVQALTGTTTWDPGAIADNHSASTTLTVTGAAVGDACTVTLSTIGSRNMQITAHVQAADTVRVVLFNDEGAGVDLPSGTVRVWVFKP
jgi:hypothetical protein